jgi:hypothetical protein
MTMYRLADRRWVSGAAVAASTLALAVAGCGGSSTTATTNAPPLTKNQYEAKLGPLFNKQIDPALKSALSNGGATNPQNLNTAVGLVTEARDAMASINPPTGIASLHGQAIGYLSSLITDMSKLRDAAKAKNSSAYQSAAKAVTNDAQQIQTVGQKFVAKGY